MNSWTQADWLIFNNKQMIKEGFNISAESHGIVYTPQGVRGQQEILMEGKTWSAKWYQPKEPTSLFGLVQVTPDSYYALPRFSAGESVDTMAPQPMEPGDGAYKGKSCMGNVILTGATTLIATATVAAAVALF